MKFVAIDVETANAQYHSICTLGYVIFQDGEIIEEKYYLINPKVEFRDLNMKIHGIKPEHVANAPTFAEIYAEICAVIENQVVVSHSAFDVQSLGKTLQHNNLPTIIFHHANSCDVSKIAWPGLRDHKLSTIAKHLGVSINHHNALADARTSGEIFIKAIQTANIPFESFTVKQKKRRVRPSSDPTRPVDPYRNVNMNITIDIRDLLNTPDEEFENQPPISREKTTDLLPDYLAYVEKVKQFMREKKHAEAIEMLLKIIDEEEERARKKKGWGVAPWYYEQLAVVYRKEKRFSDEVDILERYERQPKAVGVGPSKLADRLSKAKILAEKH